MLLEVAPGQELLYGVGLAGGAGLLEVSLDRGQLGELALVRFIRVGPRVLLEQRQTFHRSGVSDRERTRVVEESFPSSVLRRLRGRGGGGGARHRGRHRLRPARHRGPARLARGQARRVEAGRGPLGPAPRAHGRLPPQHRDRGPPELHLRGPAPGGGGRPARRAHPEPHRPPHLPEAARGGVRPAAARSPHRLHPPGSPRPHGALHRAHRAVPRLALAPSEEGPGPSGLGAGRAHRVLPGPRACPSPSGRRCARRPFGGTARTRRPASGTPWSSATCPKGRPSSTRATRASSGSIAPSAPGRSATSRSIRGRERSCTRWRASTRTAGAPRRASGRTSCPRGKPARRATRPTWPCSWPPSPGWTRRAWSSPGCGTSRPTRWATPWVSCTTSRPPPSAGAR